MQDLVRGRLRRNRRAEQQRKWHRVLEQRRGLARCFLLGFTIAAVNATLLFTWSAVASFAHQMSWVRSHIDPVWLMAVGVLLGIIAWFGFAVTLANWWSARHGEQAGAAR